MRGSLAALLGLLPVLASACGASTPGGGPGASTQSASTSPSTSTKLPSTPTPTTAPPQPPTPVAIATASGIGANFRVTLTDLSGHSLGSLAVPTTLGTPSFAAGPGGVFVEVKGRMVELTTSGRTVDLGSAGNLDSSVAETGFAVSPDGRRWAWGSSEVPGSASETITNRLWVAGIAESPHVIAERAYSRLATSAADTPGSQWQYRVLSWVPQGIVINREMEGICGCGVWFDEPYMRNTAIVDPITGLATTISNDPSMHLSSVAADGTAVLFHAVKGAPAVDAIRLMRGGTVTGGVQLSGQSDAGAALFDPKGDALVYATISTAVVSTANPGDANLTSVLRVVDLATGEGHPLGVPGLRPLAWMPDGSVLGIHVAKLGTSPVPAYSVVEVSSAGASQTIASASGADSWSSILAVTAALP